MCMKIHFKIFTIIKLFYQWNEQKACTKVTTTTTHNNNNSNDNKILTPDMCSILRREEKLNQVDLNQQK